MHLVIRRQTDFDVKLNQWYTEWLSDQLYVTLLNWCSLFLLDKHIRCILNYLNIHLFVKK